ncbi:glutamyl-tRNA(Gln) amidotransferase subunit E, partial [mine drainage metagenome]
RAVGLGGPLHSDELPGHGVDGPRVEEIRRALGLTAPDAFVLLVAPDRARAERAIARVAERARAALEGIPPETRDPQPDGSTRYSRPLPGRDRMYPETDVPPVPIAPERLDRLRAGLPERPAVRRARLARDHGLSPEWIGQVAHAGDLDEFEALVKRGHAPAAVARLLTQDAPAARSGAPDAPPFSLDLLDAVLGASSAGRFSKEGIPAVLAALASGATSVEDAVVRAGLATAGDSLEAIVERVVRSNEAMVRTRGPEAFSPLMGDVMKQVRGRYDGKAIADALRRAIVQLGPPTGGG